MSQFEINDEILWFSEELHKQNFFKATLRQKRL